MESVIAHCYRTTVNSATGYSPFRALYGREARQPCEDWIGSFAKTNQIDIHEYVQLLARPARQSECNQNV